MKWIPVALAMAISQNGLNCMTEKDDRELIEALTSRDAAIADTAAREVFTRGDRMFPLLLALEGNSQPFPGTALYNPRSSIVYPLPGHGTLTETQSERVTTLEVAALYLISAIYHGNLHFSSGALLVDQNIARSDRKARNAKEYLKRAWESTRNWMTTYKRNDLAFMRSQKLDPLDEAKLAWY